MVECAQLAFRRLHGSRAGAVFSRSIDELPQRDDAGKEAEAHERIAGAKGGHQAAGECLVYAQDPRDFDRSETGEGGGVDDRAQRRGQILRQAGHGSGLA